MKENLYDILEVEPTATAKEIKKAFYRKARKIGGPEKEPEKYKVIRDAYDTLVNEVARREYDSMRRHGAEISCLLETYDELLTRPYPDYSKIVDVIKRAIILSPDVGRLRHIIGMAYMAVDKPELAQKQLELAIRYDTKNPTYLHNLGAAYQKNKRYIEAEEKFQKTIELSPDDYSGYISLAYLYFNTGRSNEAYETINSALVLNEVLDFGVFELLFHKIQMLLQEGKPELTKIVFERVYSIASSKEDRVYAAWIFYKFATELFQSKQFSLIVYLTGGAIKLDPSEKKYGDFHAYVSKIVELRRELESLESWNLNQTLVDIIRVSVDHQAGLISPEVYQITLNSFVVQLNRGIINDLQKELISSNIQLIRIKFVNCYKLLVKELPGLMSKFLN